MSAEIEANNINNMAQAAQRLVRVPILYHEPHHALSESTGGTGAGNPSHGNLGTSFPPMPAYYAQFGVPPHSQHAARSSLNSTSASTIVSAPRTSQLTSLV